MDATHRTPSPKLRGRGFSFVIGLVLLIGCTGAQPSPSRPPTPAPTQSAAPTPTSTAEFPKSLTDDEGTVVEIPAEPQRMVSLSPAFTEIVFALGAGDRLVGGTDYDDYPPEAVALPDAATYLGVVIEKVVELDPDLVLAGGNNLTSKADVDRLRELGFAVLVTYPPTLTAVLDDIRLIGSAIGAETEAATMTTALQARFDAITAELAGLDRPKVFYEIGYQPEIYGPAPDSFVEDIVNVAGGEAITTTDPAVFSISLEQLIAADPDVIVLGDAAYGTCPDAVLSRPGWEDITAVKENAIRPVNDIVVTRPGPRIADGLALLALAIHPEADITAPAEAVELCAAPASTASP